MNVLYANTMTIKYTEEWFNNEGGYVNPHDLKAVKERIEHLPKMMDELNELLKNGDMEAEHFATRMKHYARNCADAVEHAEEGIGWGRARKTITY